MNTPPPSPELVELRTELEQIEEATGHPIARALELLERASSTRSDLRVALDATTGVLEATTRELAGDAGDDASAPFDLDAIVRGFGGGDVELERRMGAMLEGALATALEGGGKPLELLEQHETHEDGRRVRVCVAPVEAFNKMLTPLGGIEGTAETMLVMFGATTESEGDPMLADLALSLREDETIDITIRTPRQAVRFAMLSQTGWQTKKLLEEKTTKPHSVILEPHEWNAGVQKAPPASTKPKAKGPVTKVPPSVVLPPMLRTRASRR